MAGNYHAAHSLEVLYVQKLSQNRCQEHAKEQRIFLHQHRRPLGWNRLLYLQVALQYQKGKKWRRIISWASLFAVAIACSGLFGLTLLIVTKRTKEIGIRKVLGAPVSGIVRLINREFIWLIVLANLIAWPAIYYSAHKFLQNYAYRIPIDILTFLKAGFLALAIAFLTISVHAVRAGL